MNAICNNVNVTIHFSLHSHPSPPPFVFVWLHATIRPGSSILTCISTRCSRHSFTKRLMPYRPCTLAPSKGYWDIGICVIRGILYRSSFFLVVWKVIFTLLSPNICCHSCCTYLWTEMSASPNLCTHAWGLCSWNWMQQPLHLDALASCICRIFTIISKRSSKSPIIQ